MQQYQNTDEFLAIKFPNSHHLIPEFEELCTEITHQGRGWGRIGLDARGLDPIGRMIVDFFDIQRRKWRSKPKQLKKKAC